MKRIFICTYSIVINKSVTSEIRFIISERLFGTLFVSPDYLSMTPLSDTGENVQKWTRVFSTAESYSSFGRIGKREEYSVSTFGRFRLWTSLEYSPVSVIRPYQVVTTV